MLLTMTQNLQFLVTNLNAYKRKMNIEQFLIELKQGNVMIFHRCSSRINK